MNTRILQRNLSRSIGFNWGNGTVQKIKSAKYKAFSSSVGVGAALSSAVMAGYEHHMWACSGLTLLSLALVKAHKLAKARMGNLAKSSDFINIVSRFNRVHKNF